MVAKVSDRDALGRGWRFPRYRALKRRKRQCANAGISLPQVLFALAILVNVLNVEIAFGFEKANPVEKAFLLIACVALAFRGKLSLGRLFWVSLAYSGTLCAALFTSYPEFSWNYYLRGSVSFLAPLLYLVFTPSRSDQKFILRTLAWMAITEVGIGIIYSALGLHPMWARDSLGGVRLQGPSVAAFLAAAAVTSALAALIYAEQANRRYLVLAASNVVILLLTAGRMATLVFSLSGLAVFFLAYRRHLHAKVLLVLVGLLSAIPLGSVLAGSLVERFSANSMKGRDVLWGYLSSYIERYPLWGTGLGHQYTLIPREVRVSTGTFGAHNEYLRFLVECGWIGGLTILIAMTMLLRAIWKSSLVNRHPLFLVISASFYIFAATDNVMSLPAAFFLLLVASLGPSMLMPSPMSLPRAELRKVGLSHLAPGSCTHHS